jgi:predicted outer membrane repeat protein
MNKTFTALPRSFKLLLTCVICLSTIQGWSQQILYVDSAATGADNGSSWANAYTQLKLALNDAHFISGPVQIQVAKGTYYPTGNMVGSGINSTFLIYRDNIKIYGGYPTGGGSRDIANNPVYLDGNINNPASNADNSYHVMVISSITLADSVIVDGFTFRNGNARLRDTYDYSGPEVWKSYGAALVIQGNSNGPKVRVQNCHFVNNRALDNGGAIVVLHLNAIIENCVFTNNNAGTAGGAIYQEGGKLTILQSRFMGNSAAYGGAIRKENAPFLSVKNSVFSRNTSNNTGAAMSLFAGNDTLVNNLFIQNKDNSTVGGGAICLSAGNYTVVNNTFYADTTAGRGGAIRLEAATGAAKLQNNIFYKCNAASGNDVYNDAGMPYTELNNSFSTNPGFVNEAFPTGADDLWNTADDGLALYFSSAAANQGDATGLDDILPTTDLAGNARIIGGTIDLGAYESTAAAPHVLYVDSTHGNDANNGSSWALAYQTLAQALTIAHMPGSPVDSILVAKGTYYPGGTQASTVRDSAFTLLRGNLKLYGGYTSGGGSRDIANNPVYLDGNIDDPAVNTDNSYHIMVIAGLAASQDSVVLDGLTFCNGYGNAATTKMYNAVSVSQNTGGALALQENLNGKKLRVHNCHFIRNHSSLNGGAIGNSNAAVQISSSYFETNRSTNGASVANLGNATTIITSSQFANNTATTTGGAIFQDGGSIEVTGSGFMQNNALYGGAIRNQGNPKLSVKNSVFSENTSTNTGAAMSLSQGSDTLVNNLFIRNKDNSTVGGGALCITTGQFSIVNNTFYADTTTGGSGGAIRIEGSTGSAKLQNNIFYKCKAAIGDNVYNQLGMSNTQLNNSFSMNPDFVNEASPVGADNIWGTADDGLSLTLCSPAVNAGSNTHLPEGTINDIANQPRILADNIDLGAYERNNPFSLNEATTTLSANNVCGTDGWSHYYNSSGDKLILSMKLGINNLGLVNATSKLRTGYGTNATAKMSTPFGRTDYFYPFNRSWNVLTSIPPVDSVGVRFYFGSADSGDVRNTMLFNQLKDLVVYKVNGNDAWNTAATGYTGYTYAASASKTTYTLGSYQGIKYAEFYVTSFSAGSMALVSSVALPLDLLSFTGKLINNKTKLQWLTTSEVNVAHYEVERSNNGNSWIQIGQVAAKNTAGDQQYELWDNNPTNGWNYYRLKMVDIDGRFKYSKVIAVRTNGPSLQVYPNPSNGQFTVLIDRAASRTFLQLFDASGKVVHQQQLVQGINQVNTKKLSGGIYVLKIEDDAQIHTERMIITK